jgi:dTMP kinase
MFIVFEGMDGAGKSTQIRLLTDRLRTGGVPVTLTREPGGSPLAEDIRRLVLEGDPGTMDVETELLLFTAARRDHVRKTVQPALERGDVVLCDRYFDSTYALQCAGGMDEATIGVLHDRFVGLNPDLVVFFILDEEEALARAMARGGAAAVEERFERKGIGFHRKVAANIQARAQMPGRTTLIIDAKGSVEEVAARLDAALVPYLAGRASA